MDLITAIQAKADLLVIGPTGIGKSTKFPLTIASFNDYTILVVTPTFVGTRTLTNYIDNVNISYQSLTDVYQQVLTTMLIPDFDYIMIDDIQLAKLEMFFLLNMILYLNKNNTNKVGIIVAGLHLPESFSTIASFNPFIVNLADINLVKPLPINIVYTPYNPTFDEAVTLVNNFITKMWPLIGFNGIGGKILLIVADQALADLYSYNLTKYNPITIISDNDLTQLNQIFNNDNINTKQLIITTSILEVTVTIANIEIVIDTMHDSFAKSRPNGRLYFDYSWISQTQALQRTGRAGRLYINDNSDFIGQTGLCYRLCTEDSFKQLPQYYPDEINLLPLSTMLLQLLISGYDSDVLPANLIKLALEQLELFDLIKIDNGKYIVSNDIANTVSKLPLTILAASILAYCIKFKYDLASAIVYAAIIDIAGPFVNGDVLTSGDVATDLLLTFKGPSDFHFLLNLIMATFSFNQKVNNADGFDITIEKLVASDDDTVGSKIRFDLLKQLAILINQIYITLVNINLIKNFDNIFTNLNLLTNIDQLQQLIKIRFNFLIYSYDDSQGWYINSSNNKLYLNRKYPRQRQAIVLAALATNGEDTISLGLNLD